MTNCCYLIESESRTIRKKNIKEIIQKEKFHEEEITNYDLDETPLSQIIEDLDTLSFLTPRKVIIIMDTQFLTSNSKYTDDKLESLLNYLKHPNKDVLFIMGVAKCDERKKIVKEIKKLVTTIKSEEDPFNYTKNQLKDYQISKEALHMLVDYCDQSIDKLSNECHKLSLYKEKNQEITKEDIALLVPRSLIANTEQLGYDFVKFIAEKDKKRIFELYEVLKENQMNIHAIIGLIESQMRIIYQVFLAKSKNKTKEEIANRIHEHPYRVKKAYEFLSMYDEKDLRKFIHQLHELDYKIKSGKIDATLGFEVFLLSL